ncbi:hypothetical protein [Mycoplasma suis]|nr:hypothetical protein [Mycoplasma suis]
MPMCKCAIKLLSSLTLGGCSSGSTFYVIKTAVLGDQVKETRMKFTESNYSNSVSTESLTKNVSSVVVARPIEQEQRKREETTTTSVTWGGHLSNKENTSTYEEVVKKQQPEEEERREMVIRWDDERTETISSRNKSVRSEESITLIKQDSSRTEKVEKELKVKEPETTQTQTLENSPREEERELKIKEGTERVSSRITTLSEKNESQIIEVQESVSVEIQKGIRQAELLDLSNIYDQKPEVISNLVNNNEAVIILDGNSIEEDSSLVENNETGIILEGKENPEETADSEKVTLPPQVKTVSYEEAVREEKTRKLEKNLELLRKVRQQQTKNTDIPATYLEAASRKSRRSKKLEQPKSTVIVQTNSSQTPEKQLLTVTTVNGNTTFTQKIEVEKPKAIKVKRLEEILELLKKAGQQQTKRAVIPEAYLKAASKGTRKLVLQEYLLNPISGSKCTNVFALNNKTFKEDCKEEPELMKKIKNDLKVWEEKLMIIGENKELIYDISGQTTEVSENGQKLNTTYICGKIRPLEESGGKKLYRFCSRISVEWIKNRLKEGNYNYSASHTSPSKNIGLKGSRTTQTNGNQRQQQKSVPKKQLTQKDHESSNWWTKIYTPAWWEQQKQKYANRSYSQTHSSPSNNRGRCGRNLYCGVERGRRCGYGWRLYNHYFH